MIRLIIILVFILCTTKCLSQTSVVVAQTEGNTASLSGRVLVNEYTLRSEAVQVIAYKVTDGPYIAIDTVVVAEDSSYSFDNLPLGEFILLAKQAQKTNGGFCPTYYPNEEFFADATVIELRHDLANTDIMIDNYRAINDYFGVPPRSVNGLVISELKLANGVNSIACALYRKVTRDDEPLLYFLYDYVETNENGLFEYFALEPGQYLFHVEYPGIPSDPDAYFDFNESKDQVEIVATISNNQINIDLKELVLKASDKISSISCYPNPVDDQLMIDFTQYETELRYLVISPAGQELLSGILPIVAGSQQKMLDMSHFESGVYFLKVFDSEQRFYYTERLIKR